MNQIFTKKVITASVLGAFTAASGVAFANQFEASVTDLPAGTYLYSGGGLSTTGISQSTVVTTEIGTNTFSTGFFTTTIPASVALKTTAGAALAQTIPTGAANALALRVDTAAASATASIYIGSTSADAILTAQTSTASSVGVFFAPAAAVSAGGGYLEMGTWATTPASVTTAGTQVGQIYKDASGNVVIVLAGIGSTTANDTMQLRGLSLAPVAGQSGDVSIALADGDATGTYTAKLGVTAGSTKVATESTALFIATPAATPTVTQGTGKTPASVTVRFTYPHATNYQSKKFAVSLPAGCAFSAAPTVSAIGGQTVASVALVSSTKAVVTTHASTDTTGGNSTFTISGAYLNTTACPTGDVVATITSSSADTDIGSSNIANFTDVTAKVATVTAAATTISFVDTDPGTNPGLNTLYAGRTNLDPAAQINLAEAASGSISGGGIINITLNNGAKWITNTATQAIASGGTIGFTAYGTNGSSTKPGTNASLSTLSSLISASSTTAATLQYTIGSSLDLTNATAGKLTATFAGSAGVSGSVDIANIVNATSISANGAVPSVTAGNAVALPQIVITEAAKTAIATSEKIIINFPAGAKVQENGTDATGTMTTVTVKAYKADGTDITTTVFGTAKPVVTALAIDDTSVYNRVVVDSAVTASAANGAITIKIDGLNVKPSSTSSAGDFSATIASNATKSTATASLDSTTGLTKTVLKLASVVTSSNPVIPAAVVTGTATSQTITASMMPSGSDATKPGQTFVIGSVPNVGLFSLNANGAWTQMSVTAPTSTTGYWGTGLNSSTVYAVGNLANITSLPIASGADLTSLKGTVFYVGYGTNGINTDMAFTNMINNGTYRVVCTVDTTGLCK